jgi:hypothetical protein
MNPNVIPSKENTLERFIERFPIAMKHGWKLVQGYPDDDEYSHLYHVSPPEDSPIASWSTMFPRSVTWAGMIIDIPQSFWDDNLMKTHGNV